MKKLVLVFGPLIGAAILACASKKESAPPPAVVVNVPTVDAAQAAPTASAPTAAPSASADLPMYSTNAATEYEAAETELHEKRWDDATKAYSELKRKFAYSKYATLAEFRIADIAFARGNYVEATRLYRQWASYHPSDTSRKADALDRANTAECRAEAHPACFDTYDAGI